MVIFFWFLRDKLDFFYKYKIYVFDWVKYLFLFKRGFVYYMCKFCGKFKSDFGVIIGIKSYFLFLWFYFDIK